VSSAVSAVEYGFGVSVCGTSTDPVPGVEDLTVLTSWAEAVAEVAVSAPERVQPVAGDARKGAPWRAELGIEEPSPQLSRAIDSLGQAVRTASAGDDNPTIDTLRDAFRASAVAEQEDERLALRVLRSALKAREARRTTEDHHVLGDVLSW
jgi:hypothetical protein